jgi:ketosteroid isomerase-like protein
MTTTETHDTDRTEAHRSLIHAVYEAFGRGDVSFIVQRVAADARWDFNVTASDVPWHVPVTGPAEVPRFLAAFIENVELEVFEPCRLMVVDDEVLAHIRLAYRIRRTGKRVEEEQLHWWTVKRGKIARLRHFEDTAQVLAAWRGDAPPILAP